VAGHVTAAAAYTQPHFGKTNVENDNATEVLIVVTKQLRHLKSPVTLPVHQNLGWDNI
jgi:hypothetical protein